MISVTFMAKLRSGSGSVQECIWLLREIYLLSLDSKGTFRGCLILSVGSWGLFVGSWRLCLQGVSKKQLKCRWIHKKQNNISQMSNSYGLLRQQKIPYCTALGSRFVWLSVSAFQCVSNCQNKILRGLLQTYISLHIYTIVVISFTLISSCILGCSKKTCFQNKKLY